MLLTPGHTLSGATTAVETDGAAQECLEQVQECIGSQRTACTRVLAKGVQV